MTQILSGALILSMLHALIPNHWIPIVVIGRSANWSRRDTLAVTAIAGGAHILSTIIVGIAVGLVGVSLSSSYRMIMEFGAPIVLVFFGLFFVAMDIRGHHHHRFDAVAEPGNAQRSRTAIIASLATAMFLSPCLEIEAYFFTAGRHGWPAIVGISLIYFTVTLSGMLLLVYFGTRGLEKVRWHYLEHHEKQVTGIALVALGVMTYLVEVY